MSVRILLTLFALVILPFNMANAAGAGEKPPAKDWSFNGPFGTYDKAAMQRGLKVYRDVCAACHGLKRIYFRNLEALGYSEAQIKNIAAEYTEKARANGADYLHALLTGYKEPPKYFTDKNGPLLDGQYYNKYMAGNVIAMAPPLSDGVIAYEDGSPETLEQYSKDVSHFLAWAAEPEMEVRKRTGVQVLLFLLVFAGIMYGIKRKIWADVH